MDIKRIIETLNIINEFHDFEDAEINKDFCEMLPTIIQALNEKQKILSEPTFLSMKNIKDMELKWVETSENQWVWFEGLDEGNFEYTGWLCIIQSYTNYTTTLSTHLKGIFITMNDMYYGKSWKVYNKSKNYL